MIRRCKQVDFKAIYGVINDAAQAYKTVIPADRWHEPYMPMEALRAEIDRGVVFSGYEREGRLVGVMGFEALEDVDLIRHAYVLTTERNQGIGTQLLKHLETQTEKPILIGTWAAADWAVRFYVKNGYRQVSPEEKDRLLRRYWQISERQIETSVVLVHSRWDTQQ